jgi:NTP pyrophosphatase (non-canonical NTP hydrolase)
MELNEYQLKALSTAIYQKLSNQGFHYTAYGLMGEAGEISSKIAKVFRDESGKFTLEKQYELALECGDLLWLLAAFVYELGYDLDRIASMNLEKLAKRKEKGTLTGSGDKR